MPVDITALKGMTRAEQLAWADKYAGVAPGTMDGIWRTETGRGSHPTLIGPETKWGTAKGHFQALDSTNETISKRIGKPLDRFDFTESLVGAATLMQENRQRYGDDAKAVMAYHGGTNQANWGPKTKDYLQKVLGVAAPAIDTARKAVPKDDRSIEELMDIRGEDVERAFADGSTAKATKAAPVVPPRSIETLGPDVSTLMPAVIAEQNAKDVAAEKLRQDTPFFGSLYSEQDSVVKAAYQKTMQPKFNFIMQTFSDVPRDDDPAFLQHLQEKGLDELAGFNDDERDILLEANNWDDFQNRKFQISEDRANNTVLNRTGTAGQLGAMFIGGSLDPMTWATGLAATKAFAAAGYGSYALAAQGRGGAALGSLLAENVVANVAYDAAEQAVGAHRSVQDYAISAATGLLPFAMGARGISKAATIGLHNRMLREGLERQKVHLDRAVEQLGPDATGAELSALATKLEHDALAADAAARSRPSAEGDRIDAPALDDAELKQMELDAAEATTAPVAQPEVTGTPLPAAAPEVAVAPAGPAPEPVLPADLSKIAPRYGQRELTFANDLDRAAYAIGTTGKLSKRDADLLAFVQTHTGLDEAAARAYGRKVRDAVKAEGKKLGDHNKPGDGIAVPPSRMDFPTIDTEFKSPTAHLDELQAAGATAAREGLLEDQQLALDDVALKEWGYTSTKDTILATGPGTHLDAGADPRLANGHAIRAIEQLRQQFLPELSITFNRGRGTGADGEAAIFGPKHAGITLARLDNMSVLAHEFGHLILHHRIRTASPEVARAMIAEVAKWSKQLNAPGKATDAAMRRFGLTHAKPTTITGGALLGDAIEGSLGKALRDALPGEDGLKHIQYLKQFDEYGAEQFVKYVESHITGDLNAGLTLTQQMTVKLKELVKSLLDVFKVAKKKGLIKPSEGFEQFFTDVLRKQVQEPKASAKAPAASRAVQAPAQAKPAAVDPIDIKYGLDNLPANTPRERAEKKVIRELLRKAEAWDAANPTDANKVKTIMNNSLFNLATPGSILASSDSPLARQIAGTVLEHAQGASGRRQTVAIRAHTLNREFVGNGIILFNQNYSVWRNQRAGRVKGAVNDMFKGDLRNEFNRAVMLEQEARLWGHASTPDVSVARAADALTTSMERMRLAQINEKTPGWANLPETSRGYMPHSIDAKKYLATVANDPAIERAFKATLVKQLKTIEKMDDAFADKVAGMYLSHARTNALGGGEIPANIRDPGAADYVRQAMKAAGLTKDEVEAFAGRLSAGAPSHTKKRLKLDLSEQFTDSKGNTVRLLDIFNTDPIDLLRRQSRKVSGEVALMGNGIAGSAGMETIRRALEFRAAGTGDPKARLAEMEAFDQISAEILGRPFGDASPAWLDGALTANATANLGGMGITQLGEYINTATGIGIDGTLKAMASAPRLRAEIHALARGEKVNNSILESIELPDGGGEFGLTNYKMVTLYDNPAAVYDGYGTSGVGAGTRLLRAASFGLSSISAHRLIHAIQTRGVAEQITLKAIRYIRDGGESIALRDMGFDDATVAALKADLPNMVTWGPNGGVAKFDLRKATNKEAAAKFITAVHRGSAQLIQDSFVGEKGKWQHSGVGKVLSQFRNFPLLAAEKQWGRQRGNRGAVVASLMLLASTGAILPLVYARVALNAAGRPDRDEYIDKMTTPYALARAALNYVSMAGMAGDLMDVLSGTAQAVAPEAAASFTGTTRTGRAPTLAGIVPLLGYGDELLGIPGAIGKGNPFAIAQTLPLSNVPWLTPIMNTLRPE